MSGRRIVLGPQRPTPNVPELLTQIEGEGTVVAISAGWRHDEIEQPKVLEQLGVEVWHLPLYRWYEQIRAAELAVHGAHSARQQRVVEAKRLYRVRVRAALEAYRDLVGMRSTHDDLHQQALTAAMDHVRGIDVAFLDTIATIEANFDAEGVLEKSRVAVKGNDNVRRALDDAKVVLVAGGHVGVLHTRMRFFGVQELLSEAVDRGVSVIAWSAGAMALAEQVVAFGDETPVGRRDPEIFDHGAGIFPGAVFLPHGRQRLDLGDRARVARFAQRFAPLSCVGLEHGAALEFDGTTWRALGDADATYRLDASGYVVGFGGDDV